MVIIWPPSSTPATNQALPEGEQVNDTLAALKPHGSASLYEDAVRSLREEAEAAERNGKSE
jgi:hypothetical protein